MCLAIPGSIVEIYREKGLPVGKLAFGGMVHKCCLEYTPKAVVGDYTLVHGGFAISTSDAEEAARTYQLLEEMGEIKAQFEGVTLEAAEEPGGSP